MKHFFVKYKIFKMRGVLTLHSKHKSGMFDCLNFNVWNNIVKIIALSEVTDALFRELWLHDRFLKSSFTKDEYTYVSNRVALIIWEVRKIRSY